jgi:hypothetical protein
MASAVTLQQYHKDGDEFLGHIVHETWVSFMNVESKEQSKEWLHTDSPNKLKKFKQTSGRKLMASVFWDRKGVLMVEFVQQGTTLMLEVYCKTSKKLHRAIQNKRRGMLTYMTMYVHIQLLTLEHCWSISTWGCLTTLLRALIALQAAATCLPTGRSGCYHSASTIRRS